MSKKAVFFDIDGTILDETQGVMPSTVEAIRKLRDNGNYAFICTGRSRVLIPDDPVLKIGFDGIVASCGMYAELDGQILFNRNIEQKALEAAVGLAGQLNIMPIFEGKDYLYYMEETRSFHTDDIMKYVRSMIGERLIELSAWKQPMEANKISIFLKEDNAEQVVQAYKEYFTALCHTYDTVEMIPHGYSKGTGLQEVCKRLHIDRENSFAIGDSVNDIDMLQAAGVGIVMGNGSDIAKENGDYITDSLTEDGILHALEHFELLS